MKLACRIANTIMPFLGGNMARITTLTAKDGSKRYAVTVRLKGYPIQSSTHKRLTDAKKWVQDTESAIREGRHFKTVEAKKHTLAELIDRYIKEVLPTKPRSESRQRLCLDWWKNRIGVYVLADVTPSLISQCRDELLEGLTIRNKKRSSATVVRYLAVLSHAFTIAVKEWQWVDDSPMRKVKKPTEPRGRVRFLDDEERIRLLNACSTSPNKVLYICVILAISTGMRQSELMTLEWNDLNLKDGFLILHETKNGERRRVTLRGHALDLLKQHYKLRVTDSALLFPSPTIPNKPIELRKAFANAMKKADIENFKWHDLRHCTASYLAMNGASLAEIAEVLGHKTLSMVKRYAHLSESHVSNVVTSMNMKIFGGL